MAIVLKPKSEVKTVTVPDGTYKATLSKVTQFTNSFGLRVGFEFTLHGSSVEGEKVMRSTNPVLTAKSKLAEVITGMTGKELTSAEIAKGVDVEKFLGMDCTVLVLTSKSKNGATYSNIERIFQIA